MFFPRSRSWVKVYLPYFFHFVELEKLRFFKARSNSKVTLIKTKGTVIYHGGNNDYRGQRLR